MATATKLKLHTMLGNYPNTKALKSGEIRSDLVDFDFVEVKVANNLFKKIVREAAYDCAELAIVTYLQAKTYGKPYVLLPAVVVGRGQHHTIAYNAERGMLKPSELAGKRVGVRAYTVTTGTWVRGMLAHDYGVDLDKVTWLTTDVSHLAEYQDPPNCQQLPKETNLSEMMMKGEIVSAILGKDAPKDPRVATLIPNAKEVGKEWVRREGLIPINHVFVVRQELSKERPDVVREIYRMLVESRSLAPESVTAELPPYGFSAIRKTIELANEWSYEQKIIPRRLSIDELFDETTAAL